MKVALTPHQQKFIAEKMKSGGYLSQSEVMREALRVYKLNEQDENDPALGEALRHSLRSPLKKFRPVILPRWRSKFFGVEMHGSGVILRA